MIVRPSWARAESTHALATGPLVLTVLTGVLHAIGVAPVSMILIHVGIAICVVPLLALHAWGRRQRPRRSDLSRRTLIKGG